MRYRISTDPVVLSDLPQLDLNKRIPLGMAAEPRAACDLRQDCGKPAYQAVNEARYSEPLVGAGHSAAGTVDTGHGLSDEYAYISLNQSCEPSHRPLLPA
jgi:hypothetical protein